MTKKQTGTKAAQIMDLLNRGAFSDKLVAEKVGCSPTYVWAIRQKMAHLDEGTEDAVEEAVEANDVDAILEQRGSRYGSFEEKAVFIQGMKKLMRYTPNWDALSADTREALEMIVHKIGRVTHGDSEYSDNFMDIAGYARLVADRLEGRSR